MIIVTGGAGFIGSNLVYRLNKLGISDILIVDNLKNSLKHKNLNNLKFLDYIDKDDFMIKLNLFKKVDIIFHQGACSNTMETDGRYMMKNNFEYSKNIFHHCLENKIRFIYASSASVYGDGKKGFIEDERYEYPLNIYAFSKFLFDNYVRKYLTTLKINNLIVENKKKKHIKTRKSTQIIGLRYFNVFGPQENHKDKMASTVFHFYNQIKKDNKMKLFTGSNNFLRDFIYIDDIVDINLFFMNNPSISGIFNCGTGKPNSFFNIASIIQKNYPESQIEYIPFPDELKGKYQTYTAADITNLRNCGYKNTFTSLEEGIKKYLKCLEENQGYLEKD